MFDAIHLHPRQTDEIHHHHREMRAPTDQSVAILREMEAAARASVEESIRLEDMPLDAVLHKMHDHLNAKWVFAVFYRIGGQRRRVDGEINEFELRAKQGGRMYFAEKVRDALAKDIAGVIAASVMKSVSTMEFR